MTTDRAGAEGAAREAALATLPPVQPRPLHDPFLPPTWPDDPSTWLDDPERDEDGDVGNPPRHPMGWRPPH